MANGNNGGKLERREELLIEILKRQGILLPVDEWQYRNNRKKGLKETISWGMTRVSDDDLKHAEAVMYGRAKLEKTPPRAASPITTGTAGNKPAAYNSVRNWLNNTKGKTAAIGLAAVLGVSGIYFGAKSTFGGGPSESDVHKVVYNKIDESNWTSETNRQQHLKNIEARVSAIKECKDLGDSDGASKCEKLLNEYISTVESKDSAYAPTVRQRMEELKTKYKIDK